MDRKHEKKLREAEKAYNKWKDVYLSGKISRDELKERLRPYKYELNELNLVKMKEEDRPIEEKKEEKGPASAPPKGPVSYPPWKKRSQLTIEEIEDRIDVLSLGSRPSETLQMLYEKRYGEELSSPEENLIFDIDEDLERVSGQEELPDIEETLEEKGEELKGPDEDDSGEKKKPFWKGILKRKKGET